MGTTSRTTIRAAHGARLTDTSGKTAPNGEPYDHRFIASTDRLASDRGVILIGAWRWDEFMKRPRWIANHDIGGFSKLTEVALGRVVWVGVEKDLPAERVGPSGRALTAYVNYASTPFAQEVRLLYDEGGLDDVSVRWDPRSEQVRDPTAAEIELYGRELAWIATRVDLIELSAVLLGADPGAQQLRGELEAAVERVRTSTGRRLPHVETLIRRSRTVVTAPNDGAAGMLSKPFAGYANFSDCLAKNQDQPNPLTYCAALASKKHADTLAPDVMAAAAVIDEARNAVTGLTAWHGNFSPLRQALTDAHTQLGNLIGAASPDIDEDGELMGDTGEWEKTVNASNAFTKALTALDISFRDVGGALRTLGSALETLAGKFGVGKVVIDGRAIDIAAVLADTARQKQEIAFDLDAILRASGLKS